MKEWHLNTVLEVYYDLVERRKTIETRAPDLEDKEKDYGNVSEGDLLIFHPVNAFYLRIGNESIEFTAGNVRKYNSVEQMLENEDLQKILPQATSLEEVIKIYNSFPGIRERIKKYGIVAIDLLPSS